MPVREVAFYLHIFISLFTNNKILCVHELYFMFSDVFKLRIIGGIAKQFRLVD